MWCKDIWDNFPSFPSIPKNQIPAFRQTKCKLLSLKFGIAQPSFKQLYNYSKDLN